MSLAIPIKLREGEKGGVNELLANDLSCHGLGCGLYSEVASVGVKSHMDLVHKVGRIGHAHKR